MRHIERVQYDGAGEWLDVVFDDGRRARLAAGLVYELAGIVAERDEAVGLLKLSKRQEVNDDGGTN